MLIPIHVATMVKKVRSREAVLNMRWLHSVSKVRIFDACCDRMSGFGKEGRKGEPGYGK